MLNPNYVEHFSEDDASYTDTMVESSNHRWDCMIDYANKYSHITNNTITLYQLGVVKSAVLDKFSGEITLTRENGTVEVTHLENFDAYLDEHDISWEGWQIKLNEPISLQAAREERRR